MNIRHHYPATTEVGQVIAKSRFYDQGNANARIQRLFTQEIEKIIWANKLSPATLNIDAGKDVAEIQIFHLITRTNTLNTDILAYIDRLIPSPIIFESHHPNGSIYQTATYKRQNLADKDKLVLDDYYTSKDLANVPSADLPILPNLDELYAYFIHTLLPCPAPTGSFASNLPQNLQKARQIHQLQKQLTRLTAKLAKEKQFNRKVQINSEIQAIQRQLNLV